MAIIVHKYGGTSMGSPERIKNVARRVAKWHRAGHQMVVVVSAMSGETTRLIALAKEIQPNPDPRELDVVASTGEQVSLGLLAMALKAIGVEAVSFNGSQVAVHTDSAFGKARIESIDSDAVKKELDAGKVVIVAGFQGRDAAGNVTTLGRGGSDTSGVAMAVALHAAECLIFTDVDGVYTTDPRIEPKARKLDVISFEEMLELASLGSKVLQIRSVEFAGKYHVPLRVLSSLTDPDIPVDVEAVSGTLISFEEDPKMEKALVSGIACTRDEAKITLTQVPDTPGVAYKILGPVAQHNIDVEHRLGRHHGLHLHGSEGRARAHPQGSQRRGRAGLPAQEHHHVDERGEGLRRRHRHAHPRGRGLQDVRDARARGHQHSDDRHLGNQGEPRDRRQVHGACRARAARRLRPRQVAG